MKLKKIRTQNFRNMTFSELDFQKDNAYLIGKNGQGKTNALEATGFISSLRSFRTTHSKHLIQHHQQQAQIQYEIEHEKLGDLTVRIVIKQQGREVYIDNTRLNRVSEIMGSFPTVTLSSHDVLLIRGAPLFRRHLIDLTLSSMDADYLDNLKRYYLGLLERNKLLKRGSTLSHMDLATMEAFDRELAHAAVIIIKKRRQSIKDLTLHLKNLYNILSATEEEADVEYVCDVPNSESMVTAENFLEFLKGQRERDILYKSTRHGPHRDDFKINLDGRLADDFASEGQQRGLVLALMLARLYYYQAALHIHPVLLADDVLGELDPIRRARFWDIIPKDTQIIATGTQLQGLEHSRSWKIFEVFAGQFTPIHSPSEVDSL